jgi:PTH1 family peptidyl-tRNA hydrolase
MAAESAVRRLVVGLGNGDKYRGTRHNIGADFLTYFVQNKLPHLSDFDGHKKFIKTSKVSGHLLQEELIFRQDCPVLGHDLVDCHSTRRREKTTKDGVMFHRVSVSFLLPDTFMNLSGTAVRKFMDRERFRLKRNPAAPSKLDEMLIVTDDMHLAFGEVRLTIKGGSGGQNGVDNIIKRCGTSNFARLKIGVGAPKHQNSADYILRKFASNEQDQMLALFDFCSDVLRLYLHRGVSIAASCCNPICLADHLVIRNKK